MSGQKLPPFNAVPPRAKRDRRLQGSHHAVLQAVAEHDRFSLYNGGQPCWASVRTIARETGLHRVTVQSAIRDLVNWRYVESRRISQNKNHLAVIYDEPGGSPQAATGWQSTGCHGGSAQAAMGGSPQAAQSISLNQIPNQTPEANSAEAAPSLEARRARTYGEHLRLVEAWIKELKDQQDLTDGQFLKAEKAIEELEAIDEACEGHTGDPIGGWARRLASDLRNLYDRSSCETRSTGSNDRGA
jgi:hypothetical protein